MKLRTLLLSAGLSLAMVTSAQNQGWTATDINGVDHTIQDYIDQGKTVLVDISAHWCGPCWAWHNSEIMQTLYHTFGPDGTGDLMIFWVDGDPASNMTLLQGGSGSQGDWITGSPWPIIGPSGEGNTLANLYNISYYPTLFMHCPGSTTGVEIDRENTWQQFLASWKSQCPAPFQNATLDATLVHTNGGTDFCPGDPVSPSTVLYNQGSTTLTSATVKLMQGSSVLQTVNWTGTLANGASTNVNFNAQTLTGPVTYTYEVSAPNGGTDGFPAGDVQHGDYVTASSVSYAIEVEVKTDTYADEIAWRLLDPNGSVVAEGGNYTQVGPSDNCTGTYPAPSGPGMYNDNTTNTHTIWLTEIGCYTLEAFDYYGDGIVGGWVRINDTGGSMILEVDYTCEGAGSVANDAVGITEAELEASVEIYPNPTSGNVTVSFGPAAKADLDVFNVLGERVMGMQLTGPQAEVSLSELNSGIYYFNLTADGATTTRKVTVNK